MKNNIKKTALLVVTIIFLVLLPRQTVKAENFNLSLNDSYVWGNISKKGDTDYYTFTITQPSKVEISYQGHSISSSWVKLYNDDMTNQYWDELVWDSSAQKPVTEDGSFALEAGTYKIQIYGYSNNIGTYRVKAKAIPYGNNEKEPNNGFDKAMSLTENVPVKGLISIDDTSDFYRIQLNSRQKLILNFVSTIRNVYVTVYDGEFRELKKYGVWAENESSPKTGEWEFVWNPGTYYVKVSKDYSYCGTYTIKYKNAVLATGVSIAGDNEVTAGTSFALSATVYPANVTNGAVTWSSSDTSVARVDENGYVTTYNPGETIITATTQDGSNVKGTYQLIVTPKMVNKPHLTMYRGKKKVRVSWGSQSGVSGYQVQYGKKSNFKGAKSVKVSKSKSYKEIKKLTKNKKYYFRVRAYININGKTYYGPWSPKKSVKVK